MGRPTNGYTIEWLKLNPIPGSCIAISNQPFVLYQQTVIKILLTYLFQVESFGAVSKDNV